MLAAGGYAGSMQLWDARAAQLPSVCLPLPATRAGGTALTALHCCADSHCAVAGTADGRVCIWDLRFVHDRRPQVFGAMGARIHHSAPAAVCTLGRQMAANPTALPPSAQLALLLASLPSLPSFEAASEVAMANTAGRIPLHRAPPLAVEGYTGAVTQLLPDAQEPRRVAFSVACGAAGAPACLCMRRRSYFDVLS